MRAIKSDLCVDLGFATPYQSFHVSNLEVGITPIHLQVKSVRALSLSRSGVLMAAQNAALRCVRNRSGRTLRIHLQYPQAQNGD